MKKKTKVTKAAAGAVLDSATKRASASVKKTSTKKNKMSGY
jgi:hypothetical protein